MTYKPLKQEEPSKAGGLNAGYVIFDECVFEGKVNEDEIIRK
ncbi:hypothetical protein [Paenibacillus glycanilyticus]|nr:hypothetical protein [Paenibacillus glycanilyticus]